MIQPTLSHLPADDSEPLWDMSVGDLLRRAAGLAPEQTALIEVVPQGAPSLIDHSRTDRRWTYRELLADAEDCAHWLLARFQPGEAICIWAPNVPEWIILQYGAALAGLVLVTANPALREAELRHVLRQSGAVALFHIQAFRGYDMGGVASAVADEVRELVSLSGFTDRIAGAPRDRALPVVTPDAPVQIQFTSGTTGAPKGAVLRHRGMVSNAAFSVSRSKQAHEVWVSPMPLFHTAGSGMTVMGAAATLSTLALPCLFDPVLMLETIERERGTVMGGVPTMLLAMTEVLASKPYDVGSMRVIISGGAPVPPALHSRVEAAFGASVTTLYGQTELSPTLTITTPEDSQNDRAVTVGPRLPHVEVRLVDPASGAVVPVGEEGEVQARGYQTMSHYIGQGEATARTLLPDGWLRTGDLGRLDARGYLQITGRLSDMIIRGGENIYPAEIEAAMLSHTDVAEIAVLGLDDDTWGEVVAAVVRAHDPARSPCPEALKAHCRERLAPHKSPSVWYVIDAMPLTTSGKVQKFALKDRIGAGQLSAL